jgi:hypothetical protein
MNLFARAFSLALKTSEDQKPNQNENVADDGEPIVSFVVL